MRLASVATCSIALLAACSEPHGCHDGPVRWQTRVASHVPARPGAFGTDWALRLGATDDVLAVSGQFSSDLELDGASVPGVVPRTASFVASYARDGTPRWSRVIGGALDTRALDVGVARDGRVVVIGTFQGDVTLDGTTLCGANAGVDVFVASLDRASGTPTWARCVGSSSWDHAAAVAIAADGDVIIVGEHAAAIDFGGGELAGEGAFVARFSGVDGALVWSVELRSDAGEQPVAIAIDAAGDVVVAGHDDRGDVFATARSGSDGAPIWARAIETPGEDRLADVALGPDGEIFLAGWAVSHPFSPRTFQIDAGLLVALAPDGGTVTWSRRDPTFDPEAIAASSFGVWVTGEVVGTVGCADGSTVSAAGAEADVYVARFDAHSGERETLARYGGRFSDGAFGIVTNDDAWIVAAYIDASLDEPSLDAFGDYAGAGIVLFAGE